MSSPRWVLGYEEPSVRQGWDWLHFAGTEAAALQTEIASLEDEGRAYLVFDEAA